MLLDDIGETYWTRREKDLAVWEAMLVWGAMTSYWRARGVFSASPATTWYDLSAQLPALRSRVWTLGTMVEDIQYMCLESPGGIAGTGMSAQISVTSILQAIQRARNQFVIDALLPLSVANPLVVPPSPQGNVAFTPDVVALHRVGWQDTYSGAWSNLWREDAWASDHNAPTWPLKPGLPLTFSESELSPLVLQLNPPPANIGVVEGLVVQSRMLDLTDEDATFDVPDEWVHAIKYAALADIFSPGSQGSDTVRCQYAEMRYQQAITAAQSARSIIRVMLNDAPLPLDSMAALDAGIPYWRNTTRPRPEFAGALHDMIALGPMPDRLCGVTTDVVRSAPLAVDGEFVQMGPEDVAQVLNYASHTLNFKCGGNDFKSTFPQYDAFLTGVEGRGQITKAKIRYLNPLLNQPEKEQQERPDRMEKQNA